jgi:hypothetical protein
LEQTTQLRRCKQTHQLVMLLLVVVVIAAATAAAAAAAAAPAVAAAAGTAQHVLHGRADDTQPLQPVLLLLLSAAVNIHCCTSCL